MQKREKHFEKMHTSSLQGYNDYFNKTNNRLNNNISISEKTQSFI